MRTAFKATLLVAVVLVCSICPRNAIAAELCVDLTSPSGASQWAFKGEGGKISGGELVLDGCKRLSAGFYLPHEFQDVTVKARFLVEPQAQGVLACGFMVRAADGGNYYSVHFDRASAILVRSSTALSWNEIRRAGSPRKPLDAWQEAQLECRGDALRVSFNGKLLYEAKDGKLARGRIGFYGSQGVVHVKDIVITGNPLVPQRDLTFPPPNHVAVCEDAGAGAYEAFPDVCRLSDGRLMCVFYAGYGHISLPCERLPKGGRIAYCISSDEGRTWSPAQTLVDTPADDRDPSIVQLPSGRLICNFFSLRKDSQAKRAFTGLGTWIVSSDDLGKTWSAPRQLSKSYYCSSPIRILSGGRLILGLYAETTAAAHGAVVYSDDNGQTWSKEVDIDNGGVRLDAETDLIQRKDGTLYAVLRAKACYAISSDRGASWTVSRPIGFAAHCPYLLRTKDDIIVLAHRLPSTSLHYSLDECRSWSPNVLVDEVGGAYPSMVNLKDGSVLIVYYEEGAGSNIRAKRFRATRQGVGWLPLK